MPKFRVLIEGSQIEIASGEDGPIRGFFVTRLVTADDETKAERLAKEQVMAEWATGPYSKHGALPTVAVAKFERVGLIGQTRETDTGYVFHPGS